MSCVIVVSFFVYFIVRDKMRSEHHHRETMRMTAVLEKDLTKLYSSNP